MELHYQNKNDAAYERLFDALISDTFGFSFAPWLERKLWDGRYESFSFVENGEMLSNICLFRAELDIGGEKRTAYQLGAVATRDHARGKGLSRMLMRHIFEAHPNAPMFLFANENVLDFYPRFGFRRVYESKPVVACSIDNPNVSVHRLSPDSPVAQQYLANHRKYSNALYCGNVESVEMFHMLLSYRDDIYHIPALDTLIVATAAETELHIAYMNKPDDVSLGDLVPMLPFCGIKSLSFGFMPDLLAAPCQWQRLESGDDSMFVRGDIPLPEPFAFPALAKT